MENERERVPLRNKNGIQDRMLGFLYKTKPGRVLLRWLIVPGVSKAAGYFMDSSFSTLFIKPFIKSSISEFETFWWNGDVHTYNSSTWVFEAKRYEC